MTTLRLIRLGDDEALAELLERNPITEAALQSKFLQPLITACWAQ